MVYCWLRLVKDLQMKHYYKTQPGGSSSSHGVHQCRVMNTLANRPDTPVQVLPGSVVFGGGAAAGLAGGELLLLAYCWLVVSCCCWELYLRM